MAKHMPSTLRVVNPSPKTRTPIAEEKTRNIAKMGVPTLTGPSDNDWYNEMIPIPKRCPTRARTPLFVTTDT